VKIVRSYLKNKTFRAKNEETRSPERRIIAGVPQGSLLSLFLFSIFTADAPTPREDAASTTALYADNTTVLVRHSNAQHVTQKLQRAVDTLEEWFRFWRIDVNAAKSSAILFTKRKSTQRRTAEPDGEVNMFGSPIPWKTEAKYLGVDLDRGLTFSCR
jgi:hypothetical protein